MSLQFTVSGGDYANSPGYMLVPKTDADYFKFEGLSPEVRNMIYKLFFDVTRDLFESSITEKNAVIKYKAGKALYVRRDSPQGRRTGPPISNTALLLVNKQIHREIASFLYDSGTFNFQSTNKLKQFAKSITTVGLRAQPNLTNMLAYHVHVRVQDVSPSSLNAACLALRKADKLRSLTMEYSPNDYLWDDATPSLPATGLYVSVGRIFIGGHIPNSTLSDLFKLVNAKSQLMRANRTNPNFSGPARVADIIHFLRKACQNGKGIFSKCRLTRCKEAARERDKAHGEMLSAMVRAKLEERL